MILNSDLWSANTGRSWRHRYNLPWSRYAKIIILTAGQAWLPVHQRPAWAQHGSKSAPTFSDLGQAVACAHGAWEKDRRFKRCFLFDLAQLPASEQHSRHAAALPTHPQAQAYNGADGLDSQFGPWAQKHSAIPQVSWETDKQATTFVPPKGSKWVTPSLKWAAGWMHLLPSISLIMIWFENLFPKRLLLQRRFEEDDWDKRRMCSTTSSPISGFKPCLLLPGTNPYCPKRFQQVTEAVQTTSKVPNTFFARTRDLLTGKDMPKSA